MHEIWQSIARWYGGVKAHWHFRASLGHVLSEVDAFYNPRRRHAIELRQEEILKREEDDDGAGDGGDDRDEDGGPEPPIVKQWR
jgi:hypothetical protein